MQAASNLTQVSHAARKLGSATKCTIAGKPLKLRRNCAAQNRSLFTFLESSSARLFVVCNVCAPYSGDWNFRQCFYAIWYLGHLWPFDKKILRRSSQGNPSVEGKG